MKVLVVDDSVVFRTQIVNALSRSPQIEIVGTAAHGRIALQKLEQTEVDLVTLDFEMPEMSGIEVLKEIKKRNIKVRTIVFSSQTLRGAESALAALREGADDVVAKPAGDNVNYENASQIIADILIPKILQFQLRSIEEKKSKTNSDLGIAPKLAVNNARKDLSSFMPSVIVIGSSTGGPTALEYVFSQIKGPIAVPILIAQHMPPVFTDILAKRLGDITGIPAAEGRSGEVIKPNRIYIAPGNFHMTISGSRESAQIMLNQTEARNSVRPAVDCLFETAAEVYRASTLGIVLTGMGEDGLIGAKAIRSQNGGILIQDKDSCVVFGMPGAIFDANEYDGIADLNGVRGLLNKMIHRG